jgi:hypothetical protein
MSAMTEMNGLRIYIQQAWVTRPVSGWVRYRQPPIPPRGKRKGTRRQWKRAHPQGLRWRTWQVEVDDHPILQTRDSLIMTQNTERRLREQLAFHDASRPKGNSR